MAHQLHPLDFKTPSDGSIHELFEYLISIKNAMQTAINNLFISLKHSTTGMPSKPDIFSALASKMINMIEDCQCAIDGLSALIIKLNSLRGNEYSQNVYHLNAFRLAADEPSAQHTNMDIIRIIQGINVRLTEMAEIAEDYYPKENILKAISDTIDSAQSTIEYETRGVACIGARGACTSNPWGGGHCHWGSC